jgi:hypothetical protein
MIRMAPVRWLLLGLLVTTLGWAIGCTFLVTFNDAPAATCDGGDCDAGVDVGSDGYAPCLGRLGAFCGNDSLPGYAGSPSDLVTCDNGSIDNVLPCDGGAGCLTIPGLPDTCDPCGAKNAGAYCGREFVTFPPDDSDVLVACTDSGAANRVTVCPSVCLPAGGDASCRAF